MKPPRITCFGLALLLVALAAAARATDRPLTPADNLQAALSTAVPGDTFILADGQYGGAYVSTRPGTALQPVTVRAANPGKAIISGNAVGRQDGLSLYKCPWWVLDGLVTEKASRAGVYLGGSSNVTLRGHTSRFNGVVGMLTGSSSNGTVEDSLFAFNAQQHGAYVSGAVTGWTFRRCRFISNGRAGLQMNSQGSGGVVSDCLVEKCSFWDNGRNLEAAAINAIGVTNTVIRDCWFDGNLAGGVSFSGNGTATGQSTGNLVSRCQITFHAGQGRTCVQSTGGGTNTVSACTVRSGKANVQPITALSPSVIVQDANTVLPVGAVVVSDPIDAGT